MANAGWLMMDDLENKKQKKSPLAYVPGEIDRDPNEASAAAHTDSEEKLRECQSRESNSRQSARADWKRPICPGKSGLPRRPGNSDRLPPYNGGADPDCRSSLPR